MTQFRFDSNQEYGIQAIEAATKLPEGVVANCLGRPVISDSPRRRVPFFRLSRLDMSVIHSLSPWLVLGFYHRTEKVSPKSVYNIASRPFIFTAQSMFL